MSTSWWIGLDLGQAADYSALAVVQATPTLQSETVEGDPWPERGPFARHRDRVVEWEGPPCSFTVPHLERFPLGTSYTDVVARTIAILGRLPNTTLVIDMTGVGRPVYDLFTDRGIAVAGVTITGGSAVGGAAPLWTVPKKDLVGVLAVALQNHRLKIAPGLRHAQTLVAELLAFRVKISTAGRDTYEAWREGDHDDLVLALAVAAWAADFSYGHPYVEAVVNFYDEIPLISAW